MTRARVVGAGLSGLASAWALARRGVEVEIIEAAPAAGGLIQTVHLPQGPCETGANAFVWTPAVERLFEELAIAPRFARDASRRRYIFRGGRPRRWPLGPIESAAMAARLGPAWATRTTAARAGESVEAWGRRVIGGAATEWLLSPALQGIYGAPAAELSAEAIGIGNRRGRIRLASPHGGMGVIIEALERALRERGARFSFGEKLDALDPAIPTIVCTAADAASPLIAPHHPPLARALARIRSVPLVSATAFFEPRESDIRGFGVLFPRGTARALGVLFNSEIFEGQGALRSERWIFGDASLVNAPAADIEAAIAADRRLLTGRDEPIAAMHAAGWHAALPVYDLAVRDAAASAATRPAWLGLCGNYTGRIGVSALVERADAEAGRLAVSLS